MNNVKTGFPALLLIAGTALFSCCLSSRALPPGGPGGGKDPGYVFDLEAMPKITVVISTNEWNTMHRLLRQNIRYETNVRADFVFDKNGAVERIANIGFRVRGSIYSKGMPQLHPVLYAAKKRNYFQAVHFRLSFAAFTKERRFHGLRSLRLRCNRSDPLYAREVLSHDLLNRFGVRVPRASYARLSIRMKEDGREIAFGVYTMVEPVDSVFLRSRYGDDKGSLWKCQTTRQGGEAALTNAVPLPPQVAGMESHTLDPARNNSPTYDYKSGKALFTNARAELEKFISTLNRLDGEAFEKWIAQVMDVDHLLKLYALHVLIGSWDDYWNNGKNYYLYQDSGKRWHLISEDYDLTFGSGFKWGGGGDVGGKDVFAWGKANRPLMNKIMQRPRFRKIYAAYMTQALDPANRLFAPEAIRARVRGFNRLIGKYVDPARVDTVPSFSNNFHEIEDKPIMQYGGSPIPYTILTGDTELNYVVKRWKSARRQLGLP